MDTKLAIILCICATFVIICAISVISDSLNKRRNMKYMKEILKKLEEEKKNAD